MHQSFIKLILYSLLIYFPQLLVGKSSIDSISQKLENACIEAFQSNDPNFGYVNDLVKILDPDTIDLVLDKLPSGLNKAFAASYLSYHYSNTYEKFLIAEKWQSLAEVIVKTHDLKQPKLLYWINRHRGLIDLKAGNFDTAIKAFEKSNQIAVDMDFNIGRIRNLIHLADCYQGISDIKKAFDYAFLNLNERNNYGKKDFGWAFAPYYIATKFQSIKAFNEAHKYYVESEKAFREIGELNYTGLSIQKQGIAIQEQSFPDSALSIIQRSVSIFEELDNKSFLGTAIKDIGLIYLDKKQYPEAISHFYQALGLLDTQKKYLSNVHSALGQAYIATGKIDSAQYFIDQYTSFVFNTKNPLLFAEAYQQQATVLIEQKKYPEAREAANKAIESATQYNQKRIAMNANVALYFAYEALSDMKNAEVAQKNIIRLSREIKADIQKNSIKTLKLSYELEKERAALEQEKIIAVQQQKASKKIFWIVIASLITFLLLLGKLLSTISSRNKSLASKNREIALLNQNLESKVQLRTSELEKSTQLLNNYFENLPGMAYRLICDNNYTLEFISKGSIQLLEKFPSEIVEKFNIRNIIHPKFKATVLKQVNHFIEFGHPDKVLELTYQLDSNYGNRWVMDRSKVFTAEGGKKYQQGILIDITDKMIAEAALIDSQKELSLIYNNTYDFMGLINIDQHGEFYLESINQPYLSFLTKRKYINEDQEIMGITLKEYICNIVKLPLEYYKKRVRLLHQVIESKSVVKYEAVIPFLKDPNNNSYFNVTFTPIFEKGNNECSRIIFSLHDITESKIVQQKIESSQRDLSMIFNGSSDILFFFNVSPDGKMTFAEANATFINGVKALRPDFNIEDLYGVDDEYFLKHFMHLPDEETTERIKFARESIKTSKSFEYSEYFMTASGKKELYEVTVTPIYNQNNVCEKLFYVSRNVTQKLAAQKALAVSEKRLSSIYNSSQDFIGLIRQNSDMSLEVESINQPTINFLKEIGISSNPNALIGMSIKRLYEDIFQLNKALTEERLLGLNQVFKHHKTLKFRSPLIIKSKGINIQFETIISPILNVEGKCTHALYSARDITESEHAKQQLILNEQRLSSVYNGTEDQMAIVDISSNKEFILENTNRAFNEAWDKVGTGVQITDLYKQNITSYIKPIMNLSTEAIQKHLTQFFKVAQEKKTINFEENYNAQNGKKYLLDISVSPILNKDETCSKLLFVIRDVTLKHRAKEKMISKILETEDRERSRFAKELHDSLGQNLTVASLNFNHVRKNLSGLDENTRKKFLAGFDYLTEAIAESRNIAHNLMPQAISDFGYILTIESLIENLAESTNISFNFYNNLKNERLPIEHELSLYRVTQEAINNILKHAKANEVTIQLIKHAQTIILTIEDNGDGFNTVKHSLNSFGLNSMKNRASALSGTLDIDSSPGRGTSITLEIPV